MARFIIGRLIAMVLTMWAVSIVAFAIIQLPPGDYLTTYVATLAANGDRVDPRTLEALREQYGFGEPFLVAVLEVDHRHPDPRRLRAELRMEGARHRASSGAGSATRCCSRASPSW